MIEGGNWWRANEIVMRHLTRRLETRYRCRDKAPATVDRVMRQRWRLDQVDGDPFAAPPARRRL